MPSKGDVHDSSTGAPSGAVVGAVSGALPAGVGRAVAVAAGAAAAEPLGVLGAEATTGWLAQLGLELVSVSASEVLAEWSIGARHLQPHGIVHGGVYASVVETCCSLGAALAAPAGKVIVGVENHTSFLRPVRAGRLRARARPLHAGRQAQLWECAIVDEGERLIATGRLRVFCVDEPSAAQP